VALGARTTRQGRWPVMPSSAPQLPPPPLPLALARRHDVVKCTERRHQESRLIIIHLREVSLRLLLLRILQSLAQ